MNLLPVSPKEAGLSAAAGRSKCRVEPVPAPPDSTTWNCASVESKKANFPYSGVTSTPTCTAQLSRSVDAASPSCRTLSTSSWLKEESLEYQLYWGVIWK